MTESRAEYEHGCVYDILVQRDGQYLDGSGTQRGRANVRPTLKDAVAGDMTAAMPTHAMVTIIEFIKMYDEVCALYLPAELMCTA